MKNRQIKLSTERLYMREFTLNDAQMLLDMHQDPAITKYTGDSIPWDNLDMVVKILHETIIPQYKKGIGRWAVHLKSTDEFIGWCGLKNIGEETDLGYRYLQKYWGNGYALEAAKAVLAFGVQQQIPHIIGRAAIENKASVKILAQIGLVFHAYYTDEESLQESVKYIYKA